MVTSIGSICRDSHFTPGETIYRYSPQKMLDFQIVSGDFYEWKEQPDGKMAITYKNTPTIMDFEHLSSILPQLGNMNYSIRDEIPYFSANMDKIAEAVAAGEKVGVEGGPCLFGTDEVTVEFVGKDGSRTYFDYNTGKTYLEGKLSDGVDMAEYVEAHTDSIKAIHFDMNKPDLTPQEWAFIKYPFEAARVLDAPLVIPLPDMSYAKYLYTIIRDLPDNIKSAAMEEFRVVSHAISDLYLGVIEKMKKIYSSIHCEVVHERDKDICEKYYAARKQYIERNRVIRKLTRYPERVEPVKDYVSMPALPFYLYGTKNCIELDSMDETDSYRKCIFSHKSALNLGCILYPELLSQDKIHTIFEASTDMKEYGAYTIS